jgi:formiminotetrahydrofolate cyclodeaminase
VRHLSLDEFAARLASADPTPGGGSASAAAGAFAAALVAMLARLSMGRGADDALFTRTAEAMDAARSRLLDSVAEDARAYDAVMGARRMARGSDAEKAARTQAIQSAMRQAADVPMEVAGLTLTVLEAAQEILPAANPNAASDGGVAVLLADAALQGAVANVRINLTAIKDVVYRDALAARADELFQRSAGLRERSLAIVRERVGP